MKLLLGPHRPAARLVILAVVLTLFVGTTGYIAGRTVKSPAQALADSSPPERTVLSAPVVLDRLSMSVTFDARVERRTVSEIPAPSVLADGGTAIVTRLAAARGDTLSAGELAAEVSGRPVIVMPGTLPAYRTLGPGANGPDVQQLQRGLARAGFPVRDEGRYGSETSDAVAALYRRLGYEPSEVGAEAVEVAQQNVESAERALSQLALGGDADELALRYAREDLSSAEADLAAAESTSGNEVPVGEMVFVPKLPAVVSDTTVVVGQDAVGSLMTVTAGPLVIRGLPFPSDVEQIQVGQLATVLLTPGGQVEGTVSGRTAVVPADQSETGEASMTGGASFTITPNKPLRRVRAGTPARVIVAVMTSPRPALVVPVSAISSAADGTVTVTVLREDHQIVVPVTIGFTGDGMVEITDEQGGINAGDLVVVGAQVGGF